LLLHNKNGFVSQVAILNNRRYEPINTNMAIYI
jgi:hypothetical protein